MMMVKPGIDTKELKKLMERPLILVSQYKEELEAASRYIEENEVIHLKTKKDIPTVIEYQGRRYILDHSDTMKGGAKL
jgi:hypothetical protein